MKVLLQHNTEELLIDIPEWHYKLFWDDPEGYLSPFFEGRENELEWEVLP